MSALATGMWRITAGGAAVAAAALTRKALAGGYRKVEGSEPPQDLGDPRTPWRRAIGWAALTGAGVGVAGAVARRGVAAGWHRASGSPPPIQENAPA